MRLRTLGAATLGLLVPVLVDCRQIAGVHELAPASALCATCADAQCASQESACRAADTTCAARIDCELACDPDDVACRASCMVAPVGDAVGSFDACTEVACAPSCAGACGDVLPLAPSANATSCASCVAQACCPAATACGTSADCRAGIECARVASVPDAVTTCTGTRHPAGTDAFEELLTCVKGSCADECAYGADWTCLDSVKLPPVAVDSIRGTLQIVDASAQNQGVPGLSVRGCYITDEACANPVTATATTDSTGSVTLNVPTQSQEGRSGFIGYFEVSDATGAYLTTIAIPGFDLTQDGFTQSLIATTKAEAQTLAAALGRAYAPTTGSMIVTAVDCADQPAQGATFAVDNGGAQTILAYPFDGIPSLTTTQTDRTGTAVAGFLPPGSGVVTAKNALGQVVSKTGYFTRAGAVSVVLAPVNQ